MKELYFRNKIFLDKVFLLFLVVGLVFVAVYLMGFVGPFVAGFVISLILNPLVDFLHRRLHINRGISAAVLILISIGGILLISSFLLSRLFEQMYDFARFIPEYMAGAQEVLENFLSQNGITVDTDAMLNQIFTFITSLLQNFTTGNGNFITAAFGTIFRILLAIISAFFFIKDKEIIKEKFLGLFPGSLATHGGHVRRGILKALAGYARGQLIIMGFVGTICIVGLTIIGSPYSLFIGVGIAIFDVIPLFGAGGIFIPWVIFSLLSGNFTFAVGLLIIYILVFITRQFLEPKIVGKQMGIHPIMLLASIYIGIIVLGPVGFLAGPLMVLVVKNIMMVATGETTT